MKNILIILTVLLSSLAIVFSIMLGVQYFSSLFIDFYFTKSFGPILLGINIIIGFVILVPINLVVETFLEHIAPNNKFGMLLSNLLLFCLFSLFMHLSTSFFDFVQFQSMDSEIIYYAIMFLFFFVISLLGNKIKKQDEQEIIENNL